MIKLSGEGLALAFSAETVGFDYLRSVSSFRQFSRLQEQGQSTLHFNCINIYSASLHVCIASCTTKLILSFIAIAHFLCSRPWRRAVDRSFSLLSLPSSSSTSSASQENVPHLSHIPRHLNPNPWVPMRASKTVQMTSTTAMKAPEYARQPCCMRGTRINLGVSTSGVSKRIGSMVIDGESRRMCLVTHCTRTIHTSTSLLTCSPS